MRDEHFKVQMFRFVDVLASLRRGSDIVQHLDEYFADMRNGLRPIHPHRGVARAYRPDSSVENSCAGMSREWRANSSPGETRLT